MATRHILDTDSLTLLREGHEVLRHRIAALSPNSIATTIITAEEHLTGWYSLLRRARLAEQLEFAYQSLTDALRFFGTVSILSYTQGAIRRFEELKARRLNVGNMDLRIAAIVLENQATLITRNMRGFKRIVGLNVEDWTLPEEEGQGNGQPGPVTQ